MVYTVEQKIKWLKQCHEIMLNSNDEERYFAWILWMPDEPTEEDFIDFANDDEEFAYGMRLFGKLLTEFPD